MRLSLPSISIGSGGGAGQQPGMGSGRAADNLTTGNTGWRH
jgi:hypothetical protein